MILSEQDKAQVAALTKRIARVIGKERPVIAATACLNIIKLSAQLEGKLPASIGKDGAE